MRPTSFARPQGSDMLQELSHMDRITQLQDEIQQVRSLCVLSIRKSTYADAEAIFE